MAKPDDIRRDMTPELTPEQRLGSIIIAAFQGGYATARVPRWSWESTGAGVNFEALVPAFEKYMEDKLTEKAQDAGKTG